MKVGIIGFGNMGKAMFHPLQKLVGEENVYVADAHAEKLPALNSSVDAVEVVEQVDVVILCVKPQSLDATAHQLQDRLQDKRLLSILAGVTLDTLQTKTGCRDIVRAMPNLPLLVGKGFTAWTASQDGDWAVELLRAFGQDMRVEDEAQLDAVTAVSGSGPAYFFYLCELMARHAVEYGFSPEQAHTMAEATLIGSAGLLALGTHSAQQWRESVTSKGGTTHAAITFFQTHGAEELVAGAMDSAKARAEQLSV